MSKSIWPAFVSILYHAKNGIVKVKICLPNNIDFHLNFSILKIIKE